MSDAPTSLLEDRVRDTYRAVTTRTTYATVPSIATVDAPAPAPVRTRRRPIVAVVGIAVVVALVLGVLAFVERDDDSTPRPAEPPVDTGPIFPPVKTHVGPNLYLVPSAIPMGFHLSSARSGFPNSSGSSGPPMTTTQVWAKLGGAGRVLGAFRVSWGPVEYALDAHESQAVVNQVDQLRELGFTPIDVGGHDGWRRGGSAAFVEDDMLVSVDGSRDSHWGKWSDTLTSRQVLDIARGLERTRTGSYRVTSRPRGYRLAADGLQDMRTTGTDVRRLVYSDGAGRGFFVELTNDTTTPPGASLDWPNDTRVVEIRGVPAVSAPFLSGGNSLPCSVEGTLPCTINRDGPGLPDTTRYLQWLEPDGTRVTVITVDLGDDAVFEIARSLRQVSQDGWDQLVAPVPRR